MTLLIGALSLGLILSFLALGVLISFRILRFPDITADGSLPFGASLAAVLLARGVEPTLATAAGFCGGLVAGSITGVLHTKFKIHGLLAGILVMTALYSVNLNIMGRSNVPLTSEVTLASYAERAGAAIFGCWPRPEPVGLGGEHPGCFRIRLGLGRGFGRRANALSLLPHQSWNGDARDRRQ